LKFASALIAVVASVLGRVNQVHAQGGIVLENVRAEYRFGEQVVFHATVKNSIPIQTASIIIFDHQQNILQASQLAINPDGVLQFVFDARQTLLRPFTFVRWRYEFLLADGSIFQSEMYSVRYDDNRYAWQKLESGALRVYWYQGDGLFAQRALDAALEGLDAINEMFPADLSQPVDIFIYPSQNDLQSYGVETWVAGYANSSANVLLVAAEPGVNQSVEFERRIPHELMHVMLYRHLGAGYNNLPVWLREGMATLVEINPTTEYDRVLTDAASRNALIALQDLCASFPSQPDSAFLAYAEARSFTIYLRDTFGVSKLLDLSRAYADGVTCDRGIELVYGSSLAQMELAWREATLGENSANVALQNMLPYLILCGIVLFVPLIVGFNAIRKKKK